MSEFPKRIVYVDDEQPIRALVRESLERSEEDIILVTCGSAKELLSRLRELQPELIILDLIMPDMDGLELMEALRKNPDAAGVPVIFMTGKTKLTMQDDYKALGAIGVIHKPFSPKELPDQIREMWATRFGAE